MRASQLNTKVGQVIAESAYNTAPFAYTNIGTITSTTSPRMFVMGGLSQAEIDLIHEDDTFYVASNHQLMVVSKYDRFNGTMYFKNSYTGAGEVATAANWSPGPKSIKYPREMSISGIVFDVDGIVGFSGVLNYAFDEMRKRVILVHPTTGNAHISDALQDSSGVGGGGGGGFLVDTFTPTTKVTGPAGYIADVRMANRPHPPYLYEITNAGLFLKIYEPSALDNDVVYNVDASLGRFDVANTFEFTSSAVVVKIYQLT